MPAFRDRPERGFDERGTVVTGVTEAHKPLPVDRPSHLPQQLHPTPIVLDLIVDRAENGHNALLSVEAR